MMKPARKNFLLIFACVILVAALPALQASAKKPSAQEFLDALEKIEFSKKTSSSFAMTKARGYYEEYLKSEGITYKGAKDFEGVARYLPLDRNNSNRFVGLQVATGLYGKCPHLGCQLFIFDSQSRAKSPVVMKIYAHNLWIGEAPAEGGPRNIYTQSEYVDPKMDGGHVYRHSWKDGTYQNLGVWIKRQELE